MKKSKDIKINLYQRGIPYVSKDVDHRVNCLINALNQSTSDDYDIIALQEVIKLDLLFKN